VAVALATARGLVAAVRAAVGRRLRLRRPNAGLLRDQRGAQAARRGFWILGLGDRAHDHDAARARGHDLAHVGGIDAADGEPRVGRVHGRVADEVEADGGPAGLGRRGMNRADGDVVGVAGAGDLPGRVGGAADDAVGADDCARSRDGSVVLADVHAVRVRRASEVGSVVDHEERTGVVGCAPEDGGGGEQLVVARVLVAQLQHVDAAGKRGAQEALRAPIADEVEAGSGQSLATIAHDCEG
jgi:hypothetical protein